MELHDYIKRFHKGIERVENYGYTESVEIREEIRPQKQVVINATIVFIDESVLHIREYTEIKYKLKHIIMLINIRIKMGNLFSDMTTLLINRYWVSKNITIQMTVQ